MKEQIYKRIFLPELIHITILPNSGEDYLSQLLSCYNKLSYVILDNYTENHLVIKQTIFISAYNNKDFFRQKELLSGIYNTVFGNPVAITFVSQPPKNGHLVSIEFLVLHNYDHLIVTPKKFENNYYYTIENPCYKLIISGGLGTDLQISNILQQSCKSFESVKEILRIEGGDFSNIIRQWNYVENITGFVDQIKTTGQHYQILNDVRTEFYEQCNFKDGYPAATGVGMECGGVTIEFIALISNHLKVFPIVNPVQIDAHKYTSKVLFKNTLTEKHNETTPKFERAKLLVADSNALLYVSGTAAIKGEETISDRIIEQVQVTLKNIDHLVSHENLKIQGLDKIHYQKTVSIIRVYVKNSVDIETIEKIVSEKYGSDKCTYVKGDICRDNLLVEIEGVFELRFYGQK